MDNITISKTVDVNLCTVQRVRTNLLESRDISQVLERKPRDLEDARKVRSKEWVDKLQDLIDNDPTPGLFMT